ncbi:hypothetical protein EII34_10015 [Arachnia propionica]|uniref:Uncharacterized protein n=1 Tax=Arachnia propionica TaxID=1750 RepID=A0A3P1T4J0_9ACTN|nr:hypothetical protein [Arachnia propionica]RRD04391.1 hypothetical protein EII34_10015 [Arachnia propionica]
MTINIPQIVAHADDVAALVARLETLSDEERARWAEAMVASLPVWRRLLRGDHDVSYWVLDPASPTAEFEAQVKKAFTRRYTSMYRLVLVTVALGASPAQTLDLFDSDTVPLLGQYKVLPALADAVIARGPDWTAEFVAGLTGGPRNRRLARSVAPLVPRLVAAFDLPLPTSPDYLTGWAGTLPRPGRAWQEHFLAACEVPGAFSNAIASPRKHVEDIRRAARKHRIEEPTDDAPLLDALLGVIERDSRPGTQREALAWIEGLDLDLTTRADRLLRILPVADARVVAAFTAVLLGGDLDDDALAGLALAILPRKEKGLRRDVLKRLGHLATPSPELIELVAGLSSDTDSTIATLASTLCESWGGAPAQDTGTRGLWQEPSLPNPGPFPGLEALVLDDPGLAALVSAVVEAWEEDPTVTERALAQLVATAHERGTEVVVAACTDLEAEDESSYLQRLLAEIGDGTLTPGTEPPEVEPDGGPLLYLAAERARAVCHGLGRLPCLLSTPSDARFRVSVDDLRSRATRYVEAGVPLEATDVAVALGRLSRAEVTDLDGLEVPIRDCDLRLADVIDTWRQAGPGSAWLESEAVNPQWGRNLVVDGEDPFWHELLGLDTAWNRPYRPGWFPPDDEWRPSAQWGAAVLGGAFGSRTEFPSVFTLLPGLPSRPAATALQLLTDSEPSAALDHVVLLASSASRFPELLAVAALATATTVAAKDRGRVAELLLAAWDEGRLIGDDLVAGWRSPAWDVLADKAVGKPVENSPAKLAPLLKDLAEAGALALVWPLLVVIAEELAAHEKTPAAASTVFETVLALLPEVPHKVELPNICALAARKGSSKAITLARAIEEKL